MAKEPTSSEESGCWARIRLHSTMNLDHELLDETRGNLDHHIVFATSIKIQKNWRISPCVCPNRAGTRIWCANHNWMNGPQRSCFSGYDFKWSYDFVLPSWNHCSELDEMSTFPCFNSWPQTRSCEKQWQTQMWRNFALFSQPRILIMSHIWGTCRKIKSGFIEKLKHCR